MLIATFSVIISRTSCQMELGNIFGLVLKIKCCICSYWYSILKFMTTGFLVNLFHLSYLFPSSHAKNLVSVTLGIREWTSDNYSFALSQVIYMSVSDTNITNSKNFTIFKIIIIFLTVHFILTVYTIGNAHEITVFLSHLKWFLFGVMPPTGCTCSFTSFYFLILRIAFS